MQAHEIQGTGTALITPFGADGTVDYDRLARLVRFQVESRVDFLVLLGTTGETPSLYPEEQQEIIDLAVCEVAGRIPVVVGVGSNGTRCVVRALETLDLSGADAVLSVAPYYNKPPQEGLFRHFSAVAEASPLPVILYNVPSRTAVNMLPETTLRIAEQCPNVIGIKEASGIVSQIDMIIKRRPEGFLVFSGDDTITYPLVTMGADGVVSVLSNAFPREFAEMVRLARRASYEEALVIHHAFKELYPLLFVDGNPAGIKHAMALRGLIEEHLRLPLCPMTAENGARMAEILEGIIAHFGCESRPLLS